jgi:hypothetical protein
MNGEGQDPFREPLAVWKPEVLRGKHGLLMDGAGIVHGSLDALVPKSLHELVARALETVEPEQDRVLDRIGRSPAKWTMLALEMWVNAGTRASSPGRIVARYAVCRASVPELTATA